jgi:hypothetical protein
MSISDRDPEIELIFIEGEDSDTSLFHDPFLFETMTDGPPSPAPDDDTSSTAASLVKPLYPNIGGTCKMLLKNGTACEIIFMGNNGANIKSKAIFNPSPLQRRM